MRAALLVAGSIVAVAVTLAAPDPRALAGRLESPAAAEREEATRALADLGEAALPALDDAVRSADPDVRARAAALLARLRRDEAQDLRLARHAALRVLRRAAREGASLAEGGEADRALAALGTPAAEVLADVARATGRRGTLPTDLVLALARHESGASLRALADLWADGSLLPSDVIRAGRALAARERTADPAAAYEVCRAKLPSAAAPLRRAGVALAAGLAGRDAEDLLLAAAADPDPGVRAEAARSLGEHLPAAAAETLRALALDPSPDVRLAALTALRRVPGIPHPEPAVANAEDARADVREAAAALLVREVTPETAGVLDAFAGDPSLVVRATLRRRLSDRR